ncbi:MAG TPA: DUF5675 family protein [Chitinophagaceae bacterium]|jgi:hypothetical protein
MELQLLRTYFAGGTNGELCCDGRRLCYTIELPWKDNTARVSCIPSARYRLAKRYNPKFGRHLQVLDVPDRQCILIHPANNALSELEGCIAPVTILTGEGKGGQSRIAFLRLTNLVYAAFARNETIFIDIKNKLP